MLSHTKFNAEFVCLPYPSRKVIFLTFTTVCKTPKNAHHWNSYQLENLKNITIMFSYILMKLKYKCVCVCVCVCFILWICMYYT